MTITSPKRTIAIMMLCAASIGISSASESPNAPLGIARSGIAIPPTVGGLSRSAKTIAPDNLDIQAVFGTEESGELLTISVFPNTSGNVPVWFSQAQRMIEIDPHQQGAGLAIPPHSFTPSGLGKDSGILAVYNRLQHGKRQSIGTALFASGDWYVLLRASSLKRSAADTATWMQAAVTDLSLSSAALGQPVRPIARCTIPLARAPGIPVDAPAYGLVTLTTRKEIPDIRISASFWCLDSDLGKGQVVYRPTGTNDRYLLATDASGSAISVRGEAVVSGTPTYYSVVAVLPRGIEILAMLDRLPTPSHSLRRAGTSRALRTYQNSVQINNRYR
jgi:hypothetical protein